MQYMTLFVKKKYLKLQLKSQKKENYLFYKQCMYTLIKYAKT